MARLREGICKVLTMVEHFAGYFADFGEAVTFGTSTATVIVDLPTVEMVDALVKDVAVTATETDVSGVKAGDSMTIRGVAYKVRAVVPDGAGLVNLIASK